jgi:hypothetical protein
MEVRKSEMIVNVDELESCVAQDEELALGYSMLHR